MWKIESRELAAKLGLGENSYKTRKTRKKARRPERGRKIVKEVQAYISPKQNHMMTSS